MKYYKESRRKANWIDYILGSNRHLKKTDMMGRRERCKQLLGDFKEKIVYSKLREEAPRFHCEELALEEVVDLS
jgi:hypothetical protein